MSRYGGPGVQGGTSLANPRYKANIISKTFETILFPLGLPLEFPRITGHQKITLKFGTTDSAPTCSFSLNGGSNSTQPDCIPMFPNPRAVYNPSINFVPIEEPLGCSIAVLPVSKTSKSTRINVMAVTENVTGNNWYFTISMSPFSNVPNLITFPLSGSFVGYISLLTGSYGAPGNTLTVLSVAIGTFLRPGQIISGLGVTPGTTIVSGPTDAGPGVYTVSGGPQLSGGSVLGQQMTITQSGVPPDTTLTISYYRGLPYMRESGIPVAFAAPEYSEVNYTTNFNSIMGSNPLDTPIPFDFSRFPGQQDIVLQLSTGFYFQFSIDYGILGQAGGYIGLVAPNANALICEPSPQNCVVTPVTPGFTMTQQVLNFLVEDTNVPNVRTYSFTFYPNPNMPKKPTIVLVGGPSLGALDVVLKVVTRSFKTI
jgi:hypothetical protein